MLMGGRLLFLPKVISQVLAISIAALAAILSYILWQYLVTGRTEWTIDETGVQIIWLKHFALSRNEDISINWADIESFKDKADPNYHTLKIRLHTGQMLKFYHDNLTTGDDYKQLREDFEQALQAKRNAVNN